MISRAAALKEIQELKAKLSGKDTSCEWSFNPLREGEYAQIEQACIDGDMNTLTQLLARHNVPDVAMFHREMIEILRFLDDEY